MRAIGSLQVLIILSAKEDRFWVAVSIIGKKPVNSVYYHNGGNDKYNFQR